jgi:hypothetical protein
MRHVEIVGELRQLVAHLSDVLGGGAQMMEPTGKVHSVGAVRYSGRNAWVEGIDDAGQKWLIKMNRAVMKSALARAARSTRRLVEDWEHAGYNFAPRSGLTLDGVDLRINARVDPTAGASRATRSVPREDAIMG